MAEKRPLVIYSGKVKEIASGDTISSTIAPGTGGGGGGTTIYNNTIAFTDGDTMRRVTITNGSVTSTSKILATIRRPNVEDNSDPGYIYLHNIVKVATGSFDVLISCLGWGFTDTLNKPPNETITLSYILG